MIEILLYVIYGAILGGAVATLIVSISAFFKVYRSRPSISPELRDEIEQNAAWWDREFNRLLVSIGERSEYSVSLLGGTCGFEWESVGLHHRCGGRAGHREPHRSIHNPMSWVAVGAERSVSRPKVLDNPCPYDTLCL